MSESFDEYLKKSELPVLVDFYADWCGPCKMMAPVLKEMADEYEGRLKVIKVDTDAQPHLAERFGIRGIPTLVLFSKDNELKRVSGAMSLSQLKAQFAEHLATTATS